MKTYEKDPDAILDYGWDWSEWLDEGDSIDTVAMTVPTGITQVGSASHADGIVTAWFSGGTVNKSYIVSCKITTIANRTDERSMLLNIVQR